MIRPVVVLLGFLLFCRHFDCVGVLGPKKWLSNSIKIQDCNRSVPLPTIQSETWLVHAKAREPHLNPPGSYELSWLFPVKQGREAESSYEPGGSDVVRELSREPAMFQIGL